MIGKLKGVIDSFGEDFVLLDVQGVCYRVFCSGYTRRSIAPLGASEVLFIDTFIREDQIRLFGFKEELELSCFRLLLTVQGIGAKVALSILSTLPPEALVKAIRNKDQAIITTAPGVGSRVAARLIAELKDKIEKLCKEFDNAALSVSSDTLSQSKAIGFEKDVVSVLVNLGYNRTQASIAMTRALQGMTPVEDIPSLVRAALKEISSL